MFYYFTLIHYILYPLPDILFKKKTQVSGHYKHTLFQHFVISHTMKLFHLFFGHKISWFDDIGHEVVDFKLNVKLQK